MVSEKTIQDERHLINLIAKAMRSTEEGCTDPIPGCEHHVTACCFIKDILDQAYESGMKYDVSNLRKTIRSFGMKSSNSKERCAALIRSMKWMSDEPAAQIEGKKKGITVIFDCEVAPNMNLVCWKILGPENPVIPMLNPTPSQIEQLLEYDLIGFNCRRYDNHILHAIRLGYKPRDVYERVSLAIIGGSDNGYFSEAWDYSKTDIYDFSSEKKSLKKFEIQMQLELDGKIETARRLTRKGVSIEEAAEAVKMNPKELKEYLEGTRKSPSHREMGVDWTEDIPENKWDELVRYCTNDVLSTEALFLTKARQADWKAREILADISEMNENSTTNSLTTRIIFEGNKNPQSQFNYRFMGTVEGETETYLIPPDDACGSKLDPEYTLFDAQYRPIFP